jgi:hypothetical protein
MGGLNLQQLETLLFLFIGLIFVTLAALIIYVVVAGRRRKNRMTRVRRSNEVGARPAVARSGEVLALVREESWAPLEVEIGGKRYRSLAEIEDPQIKQQVMRSAAELIRFTGVLVDKAVGLSPLEKTYTWREDLRESSEGELGRIQDTAPLGGARTREGSATQRDEEQFLSQLAEKGPSLAPATKPTLASSFQHALRPKLPESDRPPSFVDEIEDIVQRRIQLMPSLQGRGLHVRPGSEGSVLFAFEGKEYESLDDLPNFTARQLVKDAIQEWDQTT